MLISGFWTKSEVNLMKPASKQRREIPGRLIVAESICVINRSVLWPWECFHFDGDFDLLCFCYDIQSLSQIAMTERVYTQTFIMPSKKTVQKLLTDWCRPKQQFRWEFKLLEFFPNLYSLTRDGCIFNLDYAWEIQGDLSCVIIGDEAAGRYKWEFVLYLLWEYAPRCWRASRSCSLLKLSSIYSERRTCAQEDLIEVV